MERTEVELVSPGAVIETCGEIVHGSPDFHVHVLESLLELGGQENEEHARGR